MSEYYNTTIQKCKWREIEMSNGVRLVVCYNPSAFVMVYGNCPFHGNKKAEACDYFERSSVGGKK